jgi:hypothetical protein
MNADVATDHTWSGRPIAAGSGAVPPMRLADSLDGPGAPRVIHWVPRPSRAVRALFVSVLVLLAMLLFLLAMLLQTMSALAEQVRSQSAVSRRLMLERAGVVEADASATGAALLGEAPSLWWPPLRSACEALVDEGRRVTAAAVLADRLGGERAAILDQQQRLALAELWWRCGRFDHAADTLADLDWSALSAGEQAQALALQARLRR